jgi:hypothetical protein
MLSVSHIAQRLSSGPHFATVATHDAPNYCIYCGSLLANPSRGILHEPRVCPLVLDDSHEWRTCHECSAIASAIWYYRGQGRTWLPHSPLKGAALDIYVHIVSSSQDEWTMVSMPKLARDLHYSYGAIAGAITKLRRMGLLEKRPRAGLYCQYRPLIWQLPKEQYA